MSFPYFNNFKSYPQRLLLTTILHNIGQRNDIGAISVTDEKYDFFIW